jgi:glycosyltransferase involved in cell wall biosynthesis
VRVTWVIDSATYGGAEACVVQLVRGLPELRRTVVCTTPAPDRLVTALLAAGAAVELAPPVRAGTGPDLARDLDADLVHVNMTDPATCGPALGTAVLSGIPTIADVHMTGVTDPGLTWAYQACAAVVARSRPVADLLAAAHGVDPVVVRNGVPVGPAARPGTGRPLRVRAVGRLTAQKGHDLLIEAVRTLPGIEVTVAGEGRDRDALVAAAAGLPVRFAGHVEDVPGFLAGADVFCLPSRAEALPLALLEAVVAGLPCVATDVGDIAAELGDLVVLVPPEDPGALAAALAGLAADPERRRRLGERARAEGVRRFDERHTLAAVRAVYGRSTAS